MSTQSNFPSTKPSLLLDFANTKQLDPRITFTRASTATFYNGVTVAKAEENLLLRSQEFDNASWVKSGGAITANSTAAPDGTTTADTFTESGSDSHNVFQDFSAPVNVVYTTSVYAKYVSRQWVAIRVDTTGALFAWFDIQNGVLGTVQAGLTASISNAGNGWYRLTVSFTPTFTTATKAQIISSSADNNSTFTFAGTSAFYLWGWQVEQRSSVTAYTATTTAPITNYIPALQTAAAGVPRFEHNPTTGESLGLEIEEQRTNLLTYSEQFNNVIWGTAGNVTITANTTVAPDGTITADTMTEVATNASHRIEYITSGTAVATQYTVSFYVKVASGTPWFRLSLTDSTGSHQLNAWFDLTNGVNGSTSVVGSGVIASRSITVVGNGWYRCVMTGTVTGGTGVVYSYTGLANTDLAITYLGSISRAVFLWGAQLEAGAFATSYIQTVASQVTRSADSPSMTGTNFSSWYRADEGTLYLDAVADASSTNAGRLLNITNSVGTNQIDVYRNSGSVFGYVFNQTVQANINLGSVSAGAAFKVAVVYKTDDIAGSRNGAAVITDTSATIPVVDRLIIGSLGASSQWCNGTVKKIAYYPKRLTNAELQGITTV